MYSTANTIQHTITMSININSALCYFRWTHCQFWPENILTKCFLIYTHVCVCVCTHIVHHSTAYIHLSTQYSNRLYNCIAWKWNEAVNWYEPLTLLNTTHFRPEIQVIYLLTLSRIFHREILHIYLPHKHLSRLPTCPDLEISLLNHTVCLNCHTVIYFVIMNDLLLILYIYTSLTGGNYEMHPI